MSLSSVTVNDFSKICRVCFATKELKPLFFGEIPSISVEMFIGLTSLDLEKDDFLPKQLCSSCANRLFEAYSFSALCKMNDFILRSCAARHYAASQQENPPEITESPARNRLRFKKPQKKVLVKGKSLNLESESEPEDVNRTPPKRKRVVFVKDEPLDLESEPEQLNQAPPNKVVFFKSEPVNLESESESEEVNHTPPKRTTEQVFVKEEPFNLEPETEKFHCENAQMPTTCVTVNSNYIPNYNPGFPNMIFPVTDTNSNSSTSQDMLNSLHNPSQCRTKKTPKSSTERSREFRARKRLLQQQQLQNSDSMNFLSTQGDARRKTKTKKKSKAKTCAERSREYRRRKKMLKNQFYIDKKMKTNAVVERSCDYRQKKIYKTNKFNMDNDTPSTASSSKEPSEKD